MFEIRHFLTEQGDDIFGDWLDDLGDRKAAYKIITRVQRLGLGNAGDFRNLDGGVSELKIDFGPGYRVYYARTGKVILMLLCGGDKSTQKQDIEHAKRNLQDFQNREAQDRPKPQIGKKRAPK